MDKKLTGGRRNLDSGVCSSISFFLSGTFENLACESEQPSLLAPRRYGRLARMDVCTSATEFHTDEVKSVGNLVRSSP